MISQDYAVLMAGGGGTRLWPLSRKSRPKQVLKLLGDRTMFQLSVERLQPLFPLERILVVTHAAYLEDLREQCPALPEANFILEPEPRGTAPAIGHSQQYLSRLIKRNRSRFLSGQVERVRSRWCAQVRGHARCRTNTNGRSWEMSVAGV